MRNAHGAMHQLDVGFGLSPARTVNVVFQTDTNVPAH
jgi:hypothetical protein